MDSYSEATERKPRFPMLDLRWDVPMATALIVGGALLFLWLVNRGFSGLIVRVGQ